MLSTCEGPIYRPVRERKRVCDGSTPPGGNFRLGGDTNPKCYRSASLSRGSSGLPEISFKDADGVHSCLDKDCEPITPTDTECACFEKTLCEGGSSEYVKVCDNSQPPGQYYKYSVGDVVTCASSTEVHASLCEGASRSSWNGTTQVSNCEDKECENETPTKTQCDCASSSCVVDPNSAGDCEGTIFVSASGGGSGSASFPYDAITFNFDPSNSSCCKDDGSLSSGGEYACGLLRDNKTNLLLSYSGRCLTESDERKTGTVSHSFKDGSCSDSPGGIDTNGLGCQSGSATTESIRVQNFQSSEVDTQNINLNTFCDEVRQKAVEDCEGNKMIGCKCVDPSVDSFTFNDGAATCTFKVRGVDYTAYFSLSGSVDPCAKTVTLNDSKMNIQGAGQYTLNSTGQSVGLGEENSTATQIELTGGRRPIIKGNVHQTVTVSGDGKTITVHFDLDFSNQGVQNGNTNTIAQFNTLMTASASSSCEVAPIVCNLSGDTPLAHLGHYYAQFVGPPPMKAGDPDYDAYADAAACYQAYVDMLGKYQDCTDDDDANCSVTSTINLNPQVGDLAGLCKQIYIIPGACVSVTGDNPYQEPC